MWESGAIEVGRFAYLLYMSHDVLVSQITDNSIQSQWWIDLDDDDAATYCKQREKDVERERERKRDVLVIDSNIYKLLALGLKKKVGTK